MRNSGQTKDCVNESIHESPRDVEACPTDKSFAPYSASTCRIIEALMAPFFRKSFPVLPTARTPTRRICKWRRTIPACVSLDGPGSLATWQHLPLTYPHVSRVRDGINWSMPASIGPPLPDISHSLVRGGMGTGKKPAASKWLTDLAPPETNDGSRSKPLWLRH